MTELTFEEEHKKLQVQVAELREAMNMVTATLAPAITLDMDDPLKTATALVAAVTDCTGRLPCGSWAMRVEPRTCAAWA